MFGHGALRGFLLARFAPQDVALRAGVIAVAAVGIGVFAVWARGELAES